MPVNATEESKSNESTPSGFGYSIGVHSLAGFKRSLSLPIRGTINLLKNAIKISVMVEIYTNILYLI